MINLSVISKVRESAVWNLNLLINYNNIKLNTLFIDQRELKFTNGEFIKCTDNFLKYCYNGVYWKDGIQPVVSIGIWFMKYILKIEDLNIFSIISDFSQVIPKLNS